MSSLLQRDHESTHRLPFFKTTAGKRVCIIFFLVVALVAVGAAGAYAYQQAYTGRIYRGVHINGIAVGGLTRQQAYDRLREIEQDVQRDGLQFYYAEKQVSLPSVSIAAADPDLSQPLLRYDWQRTLDAAEGYGRHRSWLQNSLRQLRTAVGSTQIQAYYELNRAGVLAALRNAFGGLERPPLNASLQLSDGTGEVAAEVAGLVFNYDNAIVQLADQAAALAFHPISLEIEIRKPAINRTEAQAALGGLTPLLALENVRVEYDNRHWDLPDAALTDWLEFQRDADGAVIIGLQPELAQTFLQTVAEAIDVEAQDAKFEINADNRVVEFQGSVDGLALNIPESYQRLSDAVAAAQTDPPASSTLVIALVVEVSPAKVAVADLNDLGIRELLGTGSSNFAGSPQNRRHNIAAGAKSLYGILIAPDEEFSLLAALGEIDGAHGYLQELVIKGDRTIPEFGGGLCQIGTTAFRAVLNAGLPITQRRNHSFQVRYYSPAGSDATIYDPYPDFRFLNDTGHSILFLTRIDGDELIYEFWGTKDGRTVTLDPWPPAVSNVVGSGAPRYLETDDLAPGQKKKVENAVPGADAYFKYLINYPDGRVVEKEFFSHYVPWQETWLVGRDPNASSTPLLDELAAPAPGSIVN